MVETSFAVAILLKWGAAVLHPYGNAVTQVRISKSWIGPHGSKFNIVDGGTLGAVGYSFDVQFLASM